MKNLNYSTKNPHGLTRDLLIEEMLDKQNLLNEVIRNRGFEDELTIELHHMNSRGETYLMMVEYKRLYEAAERDEWFGFEM